MMIEQLIEQFRKELESEDEITPEVPGVYAIPVDEDVAIVVAKIPEGITLSCDIGKCPRHRREEFFQLMLNGNLFGQGTSHAGLGLSMDEQKVVLSRLIDHDIDYRQFSEYMEDFINAVDFWRNEIATIENKQ